MANNQREEQEERAVGQGYLKDEVKRLTKLVDLVLREKEEADALVYRYRCLSEARLMDLSEMRAELSAAEDHIEELEEAME
jgi:hypothetical protein